MDKTTDLSDQYSDAQILPPDLRDFGGIAAFAGTAVTVKCFEDNSRIKELSQTPGNGKVLVVDGGASSRSSAAKGRSAFACRSAPRRSTPVIASWPIRTAS